MRFTIHDRLLFNRNRQIYSEIERKIERDREIVKRTSDRGGDREIVKHRDAVKYRPVVDTMYLHRTSLNHQRIS